MTQCSVKMYFIAITVFVKWKSTFLQFFCSFIKNTNLYNNLCNLKHIKLNMLRSITAMYKIILPYYCPTLLFLKKIILTIFITLFNHACYFSVFIDFIAISLFDSFEPARIIRSQMQD